MVLPLSSVGMLFSPLSGTGVLGSGASGSGASGSGVTAITLPTAGAASGASGGGTGMALSAGAIKAALDNAEKFEARQLAQAAKDPQVQREMARYEKVLKSAKSLDDVLNDPVARRVFMTANGLKGYVDYIGMAKKVLASDPFDKASQAAKLQGVEGAWLDTVRKYPVGRAGLSVLTAPAAIAEVRKNYIAEKRLDALDQQMPGLGSAILFKQGAPKLKNALEVLGSGLGRDVITTAFGIPKQIAVQSIEAQARIISQRVDIAKLQKESYVDVIAQRYLLVLNGGIGGFLA